MRFLAAGQWSPFAGAPSVLRVRSRSLKGDGAWAIGGVGSCALASEEAGGVVGISSGAGATRREWSERHVVKMFPMAVWGESWGGLAGGERADWRRVSGRCDESHESADGSSIFVGPLRYILVAIVYLASLRRGFLQLALFPRMVGWLNG